MQSRYLAWSLSALLALAAPLSAADYEVTTTDSAPEGVAKEIAAQVAPQGHQVKGSDGVVATVWFVKDTPVKPDFSPTLEVKYPFQEGQLVGLLQVPEGSKYKDFRGQELSAGTYTLRYGQQPMDGNHIGTSLLRDFLLAVPAKTDESAQPLGADQLSQASARSVGSNHPAIFSLQPAEKAPEQAEVVESGEFQVLSAGVSGKAGDKAVTVPIRMVVIGQGEI